MSHKPFGVVYQVTNVVNGKIYIGQTTDSLSKRWRRHVSLSKTGGQAALQRAIRKHGPDKFEIELVATCFTPETLDQAERDWIQLSQSYLSSYGYNNTLGGASWFHHTEETKQKLSQSAKQRLQSPELRHQLSLRAKAQLASAEARRELSERKKEHYLRDPELKHRLSQLAKAQMQSPDQANQLALWNKMESSKAEASRTRKEYLDSHPEALEALRHYASKGSDAAKEAARLRAASKVWAPVEAVRNYIQNLTNREYLRSTRPEGFPPLKAFVKIYGLTFGQIKAGAP